MSEDTNNSTLTKVKESTQGSGRAILMVGTVMAVAAAGSAYLFMKASDDRPVAQSTLREAPKTSEVATGVGGTEEYNRLMAERNRQAAEQARAAGGSALPTPLESESCMEAQELKGRIQRLESDLSRFAGERDALLRQKEELDRKLADAMRRQQVQQQTQSGANAYGYEIHRDTNGQDYMASVNYQAQRSQVKKEMEMLKERMGSSPAAGFVAVSAQDSGAVSGNPASKGATAGGVYPSAAAGGVVVMKPGEVFYATFDTALNSDVPGPVLATIQSGKHKGARLLGKFKLHDEFMVVEFDQGTLPDGRMIDLQGYAVDSATALPGVADEVDNHYLTRFGAIAGAAFLQGYGKAITASNMKTEYITVPGTPYPVPIQSNTMSDKDVALSALADVGQAVGQVLAKSADRPPTVQKYVGSDVGILIIKPATTKNMQ